MQHRNNQFKIAYYTLGCKVNFSETSHLAYEAEQFGFLRVPFSEVADIYVIHSCILTSQAEKKTRNAIARAFKKNSQSEIIVLGCVSQLKAGELKKLPGVSHVFGNESKFRFTEILKAITEKKEIQPGTDDVHLYPEFHISWSHNDRTRSFLKVQDGCDCYCNYCIVPFARGKSRSATIEHVVQASEEITRAGFNEIVLTGINLGDFGKSQHKNLSQLLWILHQNEQLKRIRISSLEPQHFTDELFNTLSQLPKVMPHYHIPIQAGNNNTLKRMGRPYETHKIESICKQLIRIHPDACIAADIITGFPGETEEDFAHGFAFLQSLPLAYMHVFTFSARKYTKAADLPNQIHPIEKKRRTGRLLEISAKMKSSFYLRANNQIRKVLAESDNNNGMMYGYTDNYIRVKFPFNENYINQIIDVQLTDYSPSEAVYESKIIRIHE